MIYITPSKIKNILPSHKKETFVTTRDTKTKCEKDHLKTMKNNNLKNKIGNSLCLDFLKKKCTFDTCHTDIPIFSFDMESPTDGKDFAYQCSQMCKTRCNFIKTCAKMKTRKENASAIDESDSSF